MTLLLLLLLTVKHLVCDFFLQGPYQYLNKGKYGHPGGLLHTGIHFIGSLVVMFLYILACLPHQFGAVLAFQCPGPIVSLPLWGAVLLGEALIHYHTDWGKIQINQRFDLKPNNSEVFWWLLGVDQFIHQLTYLGMVWLLT